MAQRGLGIVLNGSAHAWPLGGGGVPNSIPDTTWTLTYQSGPKGPHTGVIGLNYTGLTPINKKG